MTTFPGNLFTLLGELLVERWNRLEMTAYTLPKSKTDIHSCKGLRGCAVFTQKH